MGWRAVVLSKGDNDQQINFGYLLYEIAVESPATDVLSHARRWQREYPDNPIVRHMTGAMLNAGHVSQINSVYVRDIFNAFADDFENVLGSLDYAVPSLMAEALEALAQNVRLKKMKILDAGCGTGLCGAYLKNMRNSAAWTAWTCRKNAGSRPPQKTLHPPVQSGLKSVFVPARKRL